MPWSAPAARMREFIGALHAIWNAWQDGTPLRFQGEHYRHTLMTPMFSPAPHEWGAPPVYLAAVGPADDAAGRRGGRRPARARLHHRALPARADPARPWRRGWPPPAATRDRGRRHAARAWWSPAGPRRSWPRPPSAVKATIAFYGSTPAYRPVLELHGWEALADELHALSVGRREDKWTAMRDLVDDEVLATFAVVAEPDDVAARSGAGSTGWSTGSASTRPTRRRWTCGTRWSPRSADPPRGRGPACGDTALRIIVSSEESWPPCSAPAPPLVRARRSASLAVVGCGLRRRRRRTTARASPSGDPAACPGEVVDVVVSVSQWGDIVAAARRRLRERDHRSSRPAAVDPHDFEPATGDLAAFSDADLVVRQRRGLRLLGATPRRRRPAAAWSRRRGRRRRGRDAGHDRTRRDATGTATGRRPAPLVRARTSCTRRSAAVAECARRALPRRRRLLQPSGGRPGRRSCGRLPGRRRRLRRRPPAAAATRRPSRCSTGWPPPSASSTPRRRATGARPSNESEPAPGDLAAFEAALGDGSVDVLVHNTADRRAAARSSCAPRPRTPACPSSR